MNSWLSSGQRRSQEPQAVSLGFARVPVRVLRGHGGQAPWFRAETRWTTYAMIIVRTPMTIAMVAITRAVAL